MCGIAGFSWQDEALVGNMTQTLDHRGPDQYGVYTDAWVSLGHRRLSVIDLSEHGRQPMSNEDGTVWVTYNGEIYNFPELRRTLEAKGHVFRSRTDTEVIVHGGRARNVQDSSWMSKRARTRDLDELFAL